MVMLLVGSAAHNGGLHGDQKTARGPGLHRKAAGAQRRTAGGSYFASRCKAGDLFVALLG
jgi:hypothetical protein